MEGIKMASLDSVKTTILTSTKLRSNFTVYVCLYQDFIIQSTIANNDQSLLIASVGQEGDGEKNTGWAKRKRGS